LDNQKCVRLKALAEQTGIPMVRLAMAWALRNPDLTAVLIGARAVDHIDNALLAFTMHLSEDYFRQMDEWSR
jgi:aryl-alcohol dehydrogenase-like predicted oxidoreductase